MEIVVKNFQIFTFFLDFLNQFLALNRPDPPPRSLGEGGGQRGQDLTQRMVQIRPQEPEFWPKNCLSSTTIKLTTIKV